MRIFLILVVVVLLGLTSMQVWMTQESSQGESEEIGSEGMADIGGDFVLTSHLGKPVDTKELRGKVVMVFFGFTHCPDICPVTISTLSKMMTLLGDKADKVVPLFITVDPQRDSVGVLKDFLAPFDSRIIGLTGREDAIEDVLRSYKAYAARADGGGELDPHVTQAKHAQHEEDVDSGIESEDEVKQENGHVEYTMDHSSYVYLMNKEGAFEKIFSYNTPEQELARAVEALLKE